MAAAVKQLVHLVLVALQAEFFQTEAAHTFIDGLRQWEAHHHTLAGGDRSLNENQNEALKLEATKAAAGQSARLRGVTGTPKGMLLPPAKPDVLARWERWSS